MILVLRLVIFQFLFMDPEPTSLFKKLLKTDQPLVRDAKGKIDSRKESEYFKFNGPSIILIGLTIAVSSLGVPFVAVLTERPSLRKIVVPTALKSNGSKPAISVSITRTGQPGS